MQRCYHGNALTCPSLERMWQGWRSTREPLQTIHTSLCHSSKLLDEKVCGLKTIGFFVN